MKIATRLYVIHFQNRGALHAQNARDWNPILHVRNLNSGALRNHQRAGLLPYSMPLRRVSLIVIRCTLDVEEKSKHDHQKIHPKYLAANKFLQITFQKLGKAAGFSKLDTSLYCSQNCFMEPGGRKRTSWDWHSSSELKRSGFISTTRFFM